MDIVCASPVAAAPTAAAPMRPAPGLIVVDRAGAPAVPADTAWVAALPAARRVLALCQGDDRLARAYKRRHPQAHWSALDLSGAHDASRLSPLGVDQWHDGQPGRAPHDLLVLPDLLPWLADPAGVLALLSTLAAPGARLLVRTPNPASLTALQGLLDGDLGVAPRHVPLARPPRALSHAVVVRQLMDAGWMPTLLEAPGCAATAPDAGTRTLLQSLVAGSGLSNPVAQRLQGLDHLVYEARRFDAADAPASPHTAAAAFDVLVPTNDERQLRLNVEASPGLAECGARIVSCRGARSAADAVERARAQLQADWVLLCHQDVYFPQGFGHQLGALLAGIAPAERPRTLIGFIGLGAGPGGRGGVPAGFIVDRLHRADHAASDCAISIDEVALVVARDSLHRIDPALGWHLWATDLCLQALAVHGCMPRIVRAPLFHNSHTGWTLPAAFLQSARVLAAKWQSMGPVHTLCGTIDDSFLARHAPAQADR